MSQSEALRFMQSLPSEKKAKIFDQIAENYYNGNFSNFSKSQSDLLMFSVYLDELIDSKGQFDDYTISKQLGILQTSVRQLKKKKQLTYPRDYKWYEAFLQYSENAVFDNSGRIVISIPDPNVYIELQHAIEELGGYVEVQLNAKLLKIPPGYYVTLLLNIYQMESNTDDKKAQKIKQAFIKELNARYLKENALAQEFTEKTILMKLKEQGLEIGLDVLKGMIPGGSIVAGGIEVIGEKLFGK